MSTTWRSCQAPGLVGRGLRLDAGWHRLQYFTGLPWFPVTLHLLGACLVGGGLRLRLSLTRREVPVADPGDALRERPRPVGPQRAHQRPGTVTAQSPRSVPRATHRHPRQDRSARRADSPCDPTSKMSSTRSTSPSSTSCRRHRSLVSRTTACEIRPPRMVIAIAHESPASGR